MALPLPTATIRTQVSVPLRFADGYAATARVFSFDGLVDGHENLAFGLGDRVAAVSPGGRGPAPLVRLHSECLTGDVFGSLRCDCGQQLDAAMQLIAEEGMGVVLYLRGREGRGIGIAHKLHAYKLQDEGRDTVDANLDLGLPVDSREYGIGAQILVDLGITTMRLMSNNPSKRGGLEGYGLEIVERVPLHTVPNPENIEYLRTKRDRMGHLLEGLDDVL
jgi:3,4-dihydroxy 2-butanone 4-phosphate synthase / GTP cyclohydrolase II